MLKNWTPMVEVHNWTLCGLITQKVCFADFEVLPADKLLATIVWLSKQQVTIETSVIGAEFIAMQHRIEMMRGLRYKILMMGIPVTVPMYIYGDNKSQVTNLSRPKSTLKKKCDLICYHAI
jgi:hypothetical protein